MNMYCGYALNQLKVAIDSISEVVNQLDNHSLQIRPTTNKYSIGELLVHLVTICRADYKIAEGASRDEMTAYYSTIKLTSLDEIKDALWSNFTFLEEKFKTFNDQELQMNMTSYWGTTYSRYEWLLEIVTHVYHHRGQLHSMLIHCCGIYPDVKLFE